MKILSRLFLLAVFLIGAPPAARAFNYFDSDLLLVFRADGFNDLEYDLGPVSKFLGLANGARMSVTNFDRSLLASNFGSLVGVKFSLLAATSPTNTQLRVWLTDANLSATPTALTYSRWAPLRSTVSFVGTQPTVFTMTNAAQSYVISPGDPSAFTFIASDGGQLSAGSLGGESPFAIENAIPATLAFYELQISTATPKPPAPLIGQFTMDASGNLTFTAGAAVVLVPARITGVTRARGATQISFQTGHGGVYRLRYASQVTGPWTTLSASVAGDGSAKTLSDATDNSVRFYSVVTSNN